jgi:hypothetical protein
MNNAQRAKLAGRKPRRRVPDRPSAQPVWGPSLIAVCFKWLHAEEQLREMILRSFCLPAELCGQTTCTGKVSWEDVQPIDPLSDSNGS